MLAFHGVKGIFPDSAITGDIVPGCFVHRKEIFEDQHQPTSYTFHKHVFHKKNCELMFGGDSATAMQR